MLFILLSCFLALFAGCVTARSDSFIHSLSLREVNASATTKYSRKVSEISQCHMEGIKVEFQLDLPPATAAIVDSVAEPASNCQPEPESCDFIMQPVLLQTLALSAVTFAWRVERAPGDGDIGVEVLAVSIRSGLRCCPCLARGSMPLGQRLGEGLRQDQDWTSLSRDPRSEDMDFLNLSVSKLAVGLVSPGAYVSLTHVSFTTLDQFLIKPIGVYGSKSEIVRLLLEIKAVDEDTYVLIYCWNFQNRDLRALHGLSSPDAAHRALY
ncbi:hypothetical protein JB92DRAFT_3097369 [Gautieria morchelliformis]|nr:hypothetical protein JB92DRAFT_3097369 [Gautieria morchelliformis]